MSSSSGFFFFFLVTFQKQIRSSMSNDENTAVHTQWPTYIPSSHVSIVTKTHKTTRHIESNLASYTSMIGKESMTLFPPPKTLKSARPCSFSGKPPFQYSGGRVCSAVGLGCDPPNLACMEDGPAPIFITQTKVR